jgi:integrase
MPAITEKQLQQWVRAGDVIAGKSCGGGLTFTRSQAGTCAWVLRYRIAGKSRELTLGRYPDVALKAAQALALQARARIQQGEDVGQSKKRARHVRERGGTFADLAADYVAKVGPQLSSSTRAEIQRFLRKDLLPALGTHWAVEITSADVAGAIERIARRSSSVARRSFEILSVIFSHGLGKSWVTSNPCAALRVSAILGAPKPRRARLKLTHDELRSVLLGLPALGRENELAVRILLATCVRKGELLGARWEHVDLVHGLWTIPDEISKTGRGFVIPLPAPALGWFIELKTFAGESPHVLPGRAVRYGARAVTASRSTLNVALNRLAVGARRFSPHDLRSTARSYLAELGVNVLVAERCLNHSLGGLVAIYDKHDYLDERRRALSLWCSYMAQIERGEQPTVPIDLPLSPPMLSAVNYSSPTRVTIRN